MVLCCFLGVTAVCKTLCWVLAMHAVADCSAAFAAAFLTGGPTALLLCRHSSWEHRVLPGPAVPQPQWLAK
jgi:hypothetical protein